MSKTATIKGIINWKNTSTYKCRRVFISLNTSGEIVDSTNLLLCRNLNAGISQKGSKLTVKWIRTPHQLQLQLGPGVL